jgi:hypothetical protein
MSAFQVEAWLIVALPVRGGNRRPRRGLRFGFAEAEIRNAGSGETPARPVNG